MGEGTLGGVCAMWEKAFKRCPYRCSEKISHSPYLSGCASPRPLDALIRHMHFFSLVSERKAAVCMTSSASIDGCVWWRTCLFSCENEPYV
jgi:hypothetical protein